MKKLIIGNWKCNPDTLERAVRLARETERIAVKTKNAEVVVAPPFPFLERANGVLKKAKLGAQDLFWEDVGAYTGAVSWRQLFHLGVTTVIVGHSERRRLMGETDAIVAKKVESLRKSGLRTVLCVGEPREVRRRGMAAAIKFVERQLRACLPGGAFVGQLAVAYEPIWAIGTGTPDSPRSAADMARFIKKTLTRQVRDVPVLYGGSVKRGNAREFLLMPEIGGALVGGASLDAREFGEIIRIAGSGKYKR